MVEIPQLQIVEVPEIQMVQDTRTSESLGTAPVPLGSKGGNWGGGRDRSAFFLQNPLHHYSSQHPSWKLLQLLLCAYSPLPEPAPAVTCAHAAPVVAFVTLAPAVACVTAMTAAPIQQRTLEQNIDVPVPPTLEETVEGAHFGVYRRTGHRRASAAEFG